GPVPPAYRVYGPLLLLGPPAREPAANGAQAIPDESNDSPESGLPPAVVGLAWLATAALLAPLALSAWKRARPR
ncbi:MAG: hypothetical protein ACRDHL_11355, partial [Candidatus Promineifilaceae bacterium]